MGLLPGKKTKNVLVVRARFVDETKRCPDCMLDMITIANQNGTDITPERDGSFECPFSVFHYHTKSILGCPHDGPFKGLRLVKSAYVTK